MGGRETSPQLEQQPYKSRDDRRSEDRVARDVFRVTHELDDQQPVLQPSGNRLGSTGCAELRVD